MGVEYERAIYRQVNTLPHVLEEAVHGSPDGLGPKTLHERAPDIVNHSFSDSSEESVGEFRLGQFAK